MSTDSKKLVVKGVSDCKSTILPINTYSNYRDLSLQIETELRGTKYEGVNISYGNYEVSITRAKNGYKLYIYYKGKERDSETTTSLEEKLKMFFPNSIY